MADSKHLAILRSGVKEWNKWRINNPKASPNLVRADLSEADLSGTNLYKANLHRANLSRANLHTVDLSEAILSEADLNGANLSGANLNKADLSGANLNGAILNGAKLSTASLYKADLSGANLNGADIREAILFDARLSEEDLDGARYDPEQLSQMNLRRSARAPLIVPGKRALLIIRFNKENLPLLHLLQTTAFIEGFYDTLYLFLFSQYDTIGDLRNVLSGNIYHRLRNSSDALHIRKMSTSSPSLIELICSYAPGLLLLAFLKRVPKEIFVDIYKRIMDIIFKTDEQKKKEQLLMAEIISKNADVLDKCRKLGVAAVDLLPADEKKKILPQALVEKPAHLGGIIDQSKDSLSDRVPREDYLKAILLFRHQGLLTNKLKDFDLANLLEILAEHLLLRYQSLSKDTGGFIIEIKQLSDEESRKLTKQLTKKKSRK
jgi:hypothetical protein